jgi:hypothetical protein
MFTLVAMPVDMIIGLPVLSWQENQPCKFVYEEPDTFPGRIFGTS